MDTVLLILKIALAVGCAVGVYYLAIYVAGFWYIIEGVCLFLQMITERLTCPPRKLFRLLKIKLLPAATDSVASKLKRGPIARFAERYPVFGTAKSIRFVIVSLIMIAAVVVSSLASGLPQIIEEVLNMFPFFFIVQLLGHNVSFTLAGTLAVGFSAMLISKFFDLCMGEYKRKGSIIRWLISVVYYVVTTAVGCILGYFLSGVWQWCADKGIAIFSYFKAAIGSSDGTALAPLKIVGCALALLVLIYLAAILVSIALKEYIETICYGGMGVLFFVVVLILCLVFGGTEFINTSAGQTIGIIAFLLGTLGLDFIRVSKEEILAIYKERKNEKVAPLPELEGCDVDRR